MYEMQNYINSAEICLTKIKKVMFYLDLSPKEYNWSNK